MGRIPSTNKKRLLIAFGAFCVLLTTLCIRDGYIQIVKGEEYTKMAIQQQTMDQLVEAKRGDIVDRNGNKLAVSTVKYSVWVRPASVKYHESAADNEAEMAKLVSGLSDLLEVEEATLEEELNSEKTLIKVAKYEDRETADKIREWAAKENISGVSIAEETKRHYPNGSLAAHVLGSVTDDNNGLSGLELYYNGYLKGVPGRWIQSKDASGRTLSGGDVRYYGAEDGATLVLTLDVVIQNYVEDSIKKIYEKEAAEEVSCMVLDSKSGEVLAMASYPCFDPNNSRQPGKESDREAFAAMNEEEQLDYLNDMWRNPLVNDTYVPGSTMKLLTTSAALEEDLTHPEEPFYDSGVINVYGTELHCVAWPDSHGDETLTMAVRNSCNPVFVQLAQRIGMENFYNYLGLFGLTQTTGIDYPGEARAQIQDMNTAGPVGLATMGYGQGIAVTPVQQISMVNAIANDGKLLQPHLVKRIEDREGKSVKEFAPTVVRQSISESTAAQVRQIMQFVIEDGGAGKEVQLEDYKIGGKTGTANVEAEGDKIIASFVGVAPIEDPKITVIFIVKAPQTGQFGSEVAAPGGAEVIENTLHYLEVEGIN